MFLQIVETNFFKHLNKDVYKILNLKLWKKDKEVNLSTTLGKRKYKLEYYGLN